MEDDGFVVFSVFCSVEQSGGPFGDGLFEESQLCGIVFELGFVTGFELRPLCGIVGEPLSQVIAGCYLFEP